jgi:phosphate transport system substrate-binding protein
MAHRTVAWGMLLVLVLAATGCGGDSGADAGADSDVGEDTAVAVPPVAGEDPAETTAPAGDVSEADPMVLIVSGEPLVMRLLEIGRPVFEAENPGYKLVILEGTDIDQGVRGVLDGTIDLLLMYREPEAGEALKFEPIARGDVVLLVNPDNPVENLTREQAIAVFSGEATNWSQVGGADEPILVLWAPENHPLTEEIRAEFLGDRPFAEGAQVMIEFAGMEDVLDKIPGAVSYYQNGTHTMDARGIHVRRAKTIAYDGLLPGDPDYPLTIMAGMGYLPEREVVVQPFFDWMADYGRQDSGAALAAMFGLEMLIEPGSE